MDLDTIDWKILAALQEAGRIPFAELGRLVVCRPRPLRNVFRKLEDSHVLTGYRANLHAAALGFEVTVFINATVPAERYTKFLEAVRACPEVLECHHVSGAASFVLEVVVRKVQHMEPLIRKISGFGMTSTSI